MKEFFRSASSVFMVAGAAFLIGACSLSPEPISYEKGYGDIRDDADSIFEGQEAIAGAISLEEAIARTLKYNLQMRLAAMEEVVAQTQLDVNKLALLPRIIGNAGYSIRDNQQTSLSATGTGNNLKPNPSGTASTSSDRQIYVGDIAFNWNLLDFGLSYFTAKQSADRYLIAKENRRRTIQNIVREVENAFWAAASAQAMNRKVDDILRRVESALFSLSQQRSKSLSNPLRNLRDRETLIEIERVIRTIKAELDISRVTLSSLLALPVGAEFELDLPADYASDIPEIALNVEELIDIALRRRPDIRAQLYNERISSTEISKVFTSILPGININGGTNYTSNSFDVNSTWLQAAARVNWNLVNLITAPKRLDLARNKEELAKRRKIAVIMAAITQVNLAWRQHATAKELFAQSLKFNDVEREIDTVVGDALRAGDANELESIQAGARAIASQLELDRRYSGLRDSLTVIYASLGLDPLPEEVGDHDIATLTDAVRRSNDMRHRILIGELSVESLEGGGKIIPRTAKPMPKTPAPVEEEVDGIEEDYVVEEYYEYDEYDSYYDSAPAPEGAPAQPTLREPRITDEALDEAESELPYYNGNGAGYDEYTPSSRDGASSRYRQPSNTPRSVPSSARSVDPGDDYYSVPSLSLY